MDKLEEFKKFVKTKPFLATEAKNGNFTWQVLYETYDIFGEDHEFFQEKKDSNDSKKINMDEKNNEENKNESNDQLTKFMKNLQKIDTKKISDGLDNIKKVVGMIDEFRPTLNNSRLPSMRIKPFRRYND